MATTLKFLILGDNQASRSFDAFARSIDNANKSVTRNNTALKQQSRAASDSQASMSGLAASILGFGGASKSAGKDASTFQKVLVGLNLATGILEPALAGVVVTAGALGAGLAAAGVGAGIFGAVAKAALTTAAAAAKKADTAQQAYTTSVMKINAAYTAATGKATTAAQRQAAVTTRQTSLQGALASKTAAVAAAYAGLSAPQIALGKAIDGAKGQWNAFVSRATPGVAGVMVKAFGLLPAVFQSMLPFLKPVESVLDTIIGRVQTGLASPAWAQFVALMSGEAGPALLAVATDAANLGRGLAGILTAFLPMSNTILGGTEKLTASFARWGQSLPSHTGFQALMATFRQETPLAVGVLKNLAVVLKNVADDMTGLATPANSRALLNILQPLSQLLVSATNNQGLVKVALYLLAIRSAAKQVSGPVHSIGSAFDSLKDTGTKVLNAVNAVRGFSSAAVAAAGVQKSLAAATAIDTTATTAFAVAADGTTTSVVAMSLAEKAAAITGAALAAVNPFVWAAAAAVAVAGLGVLLVKNSNQTQDLINQYAAQDKATGFNISGYQKLASQLGTVNDGQSRLSQTVRLSEGPVSLAKNGSAAYSTALGEVTTAQSAAQSTAANLVGGLGQLETSFGITRTQAEQLAVKAGVTATQFGAAGTAGEVNRQKVLDWANGAGQATVQADLAANGVTTWTSALAGLSTGLLASQGSEVAWKQAQQAATLAVSQSTTGINGNSTAALAARAAVIQSTNAAITFAQSQQNVKGGTASAAAALKNQIAFLQQTGGNSKTAAAEIDALRQALAKLQSKSVNINVHGSGQFVFVKSTTSIKGEAEGGLIRGPGGPTADKAGLFALSDTEYVVQAAAVQKYGTPFMDAVNAGRLAAGGLVGSFSGAPAPGEANWATGDYNATVTLMEQATATAGAAAIKAAQVAAAAAAFSGGAPGGAAIGAGAAAAQAYAKSILGSYGWAATMFPPLQSLWNGESGWNYKAFNASSGATGIPQALPGSKMASAGADWRTNPATQIRWGMGYIKGRYNNPATAYSDWLARSPHWYAAGSGGAAPGWGVVGERGRELVHFGGGETVLPNSMTSRILSGTIGMPGYAAGTAPKPLTAAQKLKNQRLAELAADVTRAAKLTTARNKTITSRTLGVDAQMLYDLQHPGDKAAPRKLASLRKSLSGYETSTAKPINLLHAEIRLLRALTGMPADKKYGGLGPAPKPAPDPGTGDGTDAGGPAAGSSPSGPAPGIPVTTQVDISAPGTGAPRRTGRRGRPRWAPAYAGGRYGAPGGYPGPPAAGPYWGGQDGPAGEALAGIGLRAGRGYGAGGAGEPVSAQDSSAAMVDAVRAMHRDVVAAVGKVAPATAAGVNRGLNGATRGLAP